MNPKLSQSLEDYLEAVAELSTVEGHAHIKKLASRLKVKMPSVTAAMRQLAQRGYVIYDSHYPVKLTEAGKDVANEIIHRHKVLENFFFEILAMPKRMAEKIACRIEHDVNEDVIARIALFSDAVKNRDDSRKLQTYLTEAIQFLSSETPEATVLSKVPPGQTVELIKFGRNLADYSNYTEQGLCEGSKFEVISRTLDKSFLHVIVAENEFDISIVDAENIWVNCVRAK